MPSDWTPEGGFYEQHAGQGESVYEDASQFDPPVVPTDDQRADDNNRASACSLSDLTTKWPDDFGPSQIYGVGPKS